jgi:hypothetical protein
MVRGIGPGAEAADRRAWADGPVVIETATERAPDFWPARQTGPETVWPMRHVGAPETRWPMRHMGP